MDTQVSDAEVAEAIRLEHILIEKLDGIAARMDEIRAIPRSEMDVPAIGPKRSEEIIKGESH